MGPFSFDAGHCDGIKKSDTHFGEAMPYEWSPAPHAQNWRLSLWAYRSLLRRDFVIFMGGTALLVLLPLLAVIGTGALWFILPFAAVMFAGLWGALHVSYRRGEVLEELIADSTHLRLIRHNPDGQTLHWQANRYWVRVEMHPNAGGVENYITLSGGDRKVELGAFLDATERAALYAQLQQRLR
ncbi:Uncharacterized membrane protein [Yoonia tamlensis]|uniref:Uncharacterized membrane protein n=1 Tax=Yoonia tamlensis TaxID=390270 RepID=A0A1I6GLE7_9RHOB|nr:DUF2244 domain-containing protein [Yoonia tamlensis]SFR42998.1 Uncharacterized membrane protein [Yoonia tamlensis]